MKHLVLMTVSVCLWMGGSKSFGQNRINNLIFNSTEQIIGLNFSNLNGPAIFYTGKKANSTIGEGIAHAENKAGEIIFWVNSSGVYDKDNKLMPGSEGILADPSSTEIIISPFPQHPSRYYIFYNNQLCSNLYYSVVDMDLRNGLGNVSQLNTLIAPDKNYAEGLEIIRIPCTSDYWLIANECGRGLTRFKVSEAGISAGEFFLSNTINNGGRGELDYHKGKLGYAITFSNRFIVADFNPLTGEASNSKSVLLPSLNGAYGLEFSPDASKVYATDLSNRDIFGNLRGNNLFSYNLNTGETKAWSISNTNTDCRGQLEGLGQIELGKDGKLYISQIDGCQIVVVENPDSDSPTIRKINVFTTLSAGISDHIQSDFLDEDLLQHVAIKSEGETFLCSGVSLLLSTETRLEKRKLQWLKNGAAIANATASQLTVQEAGLYTLQVSNDWGCSILSNSITVEDSNLPELTFQKKYEACEGKPVQLDTKLDNYQVLWSNGTEGAVLEVSESGFYTFTVSNGHCAKTEVLEVVIHERSPYKAPNIFTRNGDTYNEYFEIKDLQDQISLQVYNRWGKLVYASADYKNNWKGEGLPTGSYYYRIEPLSTCKQKQLGWVMILE